MRIKRYKVCLLGHFRVGKTSLVYRYVENRFDENYKSNIGVNILSKSVPYEPHDAEEPYNVELFIWDLAGGEQFSLVGPKYLHGASGALVVCDLTHRASFSAMRVHAEELRTSSPNAKMIFVGNKMDLVDQLVVTPDEVATLCKEFDGQSVLTSAKTDSNVELAFSMLVSAICKKKE